MKNREKALSIGLVVAIALFCLAVTAIALFVNIKASNEQQAILEDNVKSRLLSACYAAGDDLDVDTLLRYNSPQDVAADPEPYEVLRQRLRRLADELGVEYIALMRTIGAKCVVVADSGDSEDALFAEYTPADIHLAAFAGQEAVGAMDADEENGSLSAAAIPFYQNGQVAGIVSVDIGGGYLRQSTASRNGNTALLVVALCASMAALLALVVVLTKRMRQAQRSLAYMAHHDSVTGLPNRLSLAEHLGKAVQEGSPFALLFIDLDNFKAVNDSAGHDAGDQVLRQASGLLAEFAGQQGFASRYGGDEFVLTLPGVANEADAAQKAQELLERAKTLAADGRMDKYGVSFSLGAALYPAQAGDAETLLCCADTAMYHAKTDGKNTYRVYSTDMPLKETESI